MGRYASSREQVVATCRALLERGYLKATEGNVSVRVSGEEAFAVTPSSYDYAKMRAADIVVLDFEQKRLEGTLKASIEAGMRAAVYRERPDVNAIVHTHQPYASALALVRRPIPALFDEQARFLGRSVEIIDYAPSGTSFLKKNVRREVTSGANAFILANHGVLVLGGDAERAVFNMALLEKVALDYLLALLTDDKVRKVPAPIREIAFAKLRGDEKKLEKQLVAAREAAAAAEAAEAAAAAEAAEAAAAAGEAPAETASPAPAAATMVASSGLSGAQLAGYAISVYPDVEAVSRRLQALVGQPLRPIKRDAMAGYLDYFETRCRRSKELTDEAGELIPGGVQHNLAFNYPFPLAIEKSEGARLLDVHGNEYIDFLQAGGPTVLGSNYAPLRDKVAEVVAACGPVTGLFHEYELKLAQLVNRLMPSCEMFRMLGSGTESVMAAIRAARAYTGISTKRCFISRFLSAPPMMSTTLFPEPKARSPAKVASGVVAVVSL